MTTIEITPARDGKNWWGSFGYPDFPAQRIEVERIPVKGDLIRTCRMHEGLLVWFLVEVIEVVLNGQNEFTYKGPLKQWHARVYCALLDKIE